MRTMSCNCHYAPLLLFTWICVWSVVLVHGSPVLVVDEDTNQTTAEGHHGVTSNDHEEVIDEDRAHRLIDIYVQMQKRTERKENVPHTKEEEKFVDYFFEDDIMLTVAQAQAVLQGLSRRQKRKLARPLVKRWQLPIPFTFDGRHSSTERFRIKQALSYWEEMTCVTFDEDAKAERKLLFIKDRGCWSYVGFTNQPNQTVSIGDGCQSNGTIAHEVGHALGFWHEQSRPDRDAFIEIHKENVSEGKLYNFEPRTWGEVTTLDVPYDLGSDMHYGAKFYAKDKNSSLTTVHTLDPHMSRVIGQRQELSFYDIKLANKAYCDGVCRSQGVDLEQPCHREGYQDPQACRRCRCPGGFAGDFCERVAPGKKAECGGTVDAERDGTIVSPGYYASEYHSGVQCTWLIKAPEGKRIFLQFLGDFGIAGHLDLCKDFVEVRYNTSLAMTGARFCIDDPPRYPLMSAGNEMLVLFRSYEDSRICDDSRHSWKCKMIFTGFKAKYYAESCGGCSNRKSSNQTVCVRRLSYTCAQPWQETIKIDCPKWWYTESCGMRTVNRVRYATCSRDETYCCGDWVLERGRCIDPVSKKKINILSSISNDIPLADDVSGHYVLPSTQMLSAHHTESPRPTRPPGDLWGPWGEWGECPRTCGGSVLVRTRKCLSSSSCGPSNIQADKQLCAQNPCYRQCIVPKRILCDMWSTCTRAVYEQCNPYCYSGFSLKNNRCFPNSMLGSKVS